MTDSPFGNPAQVQPAVELFDIVAVLDGRSYPEIEVPFYMDEAAGLALNQANKKLTELALLGKDEEHGALAKAADELKSKLDGARFIYHLRGLPNKVRQDLLEDAFAKYPRDTDDMTQIMGIEKPNDARDQYFSTKLLQAMTVKIVAPSGAVQVSPSFDTVQHIRDYAPLAALDVINGAIRELTDGPKAGFESAVQDTDFLSQP